MHARALVRSSSAMPPSASIPGNRPAAQCMSSPPRQARHSPQLTSGCRITPSPGATLLTACPTAWTQPAFSWPRVYVNPTPDRSAHWPSMMCRSVRHSPAPPTRTITSNGSVIVGSATSSTMGRCSYLCRRTVFTRARLLGGRGEPGAGKAPFAEKLPGLATQLDVDGAGGADDRVGAAPRAGHARPAGGPAVRPRDQRRLGPGVQPGATAPIQVGENRLAGGERQEGDPLDGPTAEALLVADG